MRQFRCGPFDLFGSWSTEWRARRSPNVFNADWVHLCCLWQCHRAASARFLIERGKTRCVSHLTTNPAVIWSCGRVWNGLTARNMATGERERAARWIRRSSCQMCMVPDGERDSALHSSVRRWWTRLIWRFFGPCKSTSRRSIRTHPTCRYRAQSCSALRNHIPNARVGTGCWALAGVGPPSARRRCSVFAGLTWACCRKSDLEAGTLTSTAREVWRPWMTGPVGPCIQRAC